MKTLNITRPEKVRVQVNSQEKKIIVTLSQIVGGPAHADKVIFTSAADANSYYRDTERRGRLVWLPIDGIYVPHFWQGLHDNDLTPISNPPDIYLGFPTPISTAILISDETIAQGRCWVVNYQSSTAPVIGLSSGVALQKNVLLNDFTPSQLTRIMLHCVDASNKVFDITIKSMT